MQETEAKISALPYIYAPIALSALGLLLIVVTHGISLLLRIAAIPYALLRRLVERHAI